MSPNTQFNIPNNILGISEQMKREIQMLEEFASQLPTGTGTQLWTYERLLTLFNRNGCTVKDSNTEKDCYYSKMSQPDLNTCALNLSDAIIRAGYTLPPNWQTYNRCPHTRIRGASDMAKIIRAQNNNKIDASGWNKRPGWKGLVYFEANPAVNGATGHVDLWNGTRGVHSTYPNWGKAIWFWRLGTSEDELLQGTWESTDDPKRWKLTFADGYCIWVERDKSGNLLSRIVYPYIKGNKYEIDRKNDAKVLMFLGANSTALAQILARQPGPSYMLLKRSGDIVTAEWTGLFWTLDKNKNLANLEFRSKTYTLKPA